MFKDFKIKKWEKKDPPCPDFIVHREFSKIGVELTSLIDNSLMKVRNAHKNCFKLAMEMAYNNSIEPLVVKAKYISNSRVINIHQAAKELYDFVISCMPKLPINDYYDIKTKQLQYFDWVRIRHSQYADWCELKVVIRKINPVDEISKVIKKKNKKINGYLKCCDACWLLIGVDEFNSPEAFELTDDFDEKFKSKFERVFLLLNYTDKLIELKQECT